MKSSIKYALLTCGIAYFIAAIIIFLFGIAQTGWTRIDNDIGKFIVSLLTLALSEFQGWGDFWYLSFLVPWLGSSLVLLSLLKWRAKTNRRRWIYSGLSVCTYYVIMFLVLVIGRLVLWWGNIQPQSWGNIVFYILLLVIFAGGGFGLGSVSAIITEKIFKSSVTA